MADEDRRKKKRTQWHLDNGTNKTGFLGVTYKPRTNQYVAYINYGGKKIYCGSAKAAEKAAEHYDLKALDLFGIENAVTNFDFQ